MSHSQKLIATCPKCEHETIYNGTALRPRITCKECKTRFYIQTQKTQETNGGSVHDMESSSSVKGSSPLPSDSSIPPQNTSQEVLRFIDNPDELLLSTAIRELNKPNPDPRWATILINCKKEKITTKTEVIDQFKQLSIQARVNILKGLSQKTP